MKKDKKNIQLNLIKSAVLVLLLLITGSCAKTTDEGVFDANNISNVVADNFNLSVFNTVLKYSTQDRVLKENGPYTVLAPSDAAFAGIYSTPAAVVNADKGIIARLAQYHMLDGRYELSKLPFRFNQELRSRGGKVFVTRWIKGTDTVLTVNGARVLAKNVPASNGLIQVMNRVLTPYVHEKLGSALAADPEITLFYQAMLSSGVLETVNGTGPYTIFAPDNAAMQAAGYANMTQVSNTDPAVLKAFVNHHIIRDRRFVYDYILSAGTATTMKQNMLDGNAINVTLIANSSEPGGFSGITVRGAANTLEYNVTKQNVLTGNGVLHTINGVLKAF